MNKLPINKRPPTGGFFFVNIGLTKTFGYTIFNNEMEVNYIWLK